MDLIHNILKQADVTTQISAVVKWNIVGYANFEGALVHALFEI
jgi:hypothetical protein